MLKVPQFNHDTSHVNLFILLDISRTLSVFDTFTRTRVLTSLPATPIRPVNHLWLPNTCTYWNKPGKNCIKTFILTGPELWVRARRKSGPHRKRFVSDALRRWSTTGNCRVTGLHTALWVWLVTLQDFMTNKLAKDRKGIFTRTDERLFSSRNLPLLCARPVCPSRCAS